MPEIRTDTLKAVSKEIEHLLDCKSQLHNLLEAVGETLWGPQGEELTEEARHRLTFNYAWGRKALRGLADWSD